MAVTLRGDPEPILGEVLLELREHAEFSPALIRVTARSGDETWRVAAWLELDELLSGDELVFPVITDAAANEPSGCVVCWEPYYDLGERCVDSGRLRITLDQAGWSVVGTAEVEPEALSAHFSGRFMTICYSADGLDDAFSSPFCQRFAAWKFVGRPWTTR